MFQNHFQRFFEIFDGNCKWKLSVVSLDSRYGQSPQDKRTMSFTVIVVQVKFARQQIRTKPTRHCPYLLSNFTCTTITIKVHLPVESVRIYCLANFTYTAIKDIDSRYGQGPHDRQTKTFSVIV